MSHDLQKATPAIPLVPSSVLPPVGSIVGWIGSDPRTPPLPAGWVPCDGQPINNLESPYNGTIAPNLNPAQRFLRGGTTSGIYQIATAIGQSVGSAHDIAVSNADTELPTQQGFYQTNNNATESRPVYTVRPINMSVTWILRIF